MREDTQHGPVTISDLREVPHFADDVAERIWRAWWKDRASLESVIVHVRSALQANDLPRIVVAHREALFVGTSSVIASDLPERPGLSPWIASIWVDPPFRRAGIASDLMECAARSAASDKYARVYLCAKDHLRAFYVTRGWQLLESGVGNRMLDVFAKDVASGGHAP